MRRIQIIVNNGAGTGQAHRIWNETQRLLRGYKIKICGAYNQISGTCDEAGREDFFHEG